jgi:hypothetical protein
MIFSWYDSSIILKVQLHFMAYLSNVFLILEIPTQAKNTRGYISQYIYLYIDCITLAKESRLCVQSVNATY